MSVIQLGGTRRGGLFGAKKIPPDSGRVYPGGEDFPYGSTPRG